MKTYFYCKVWQALGYKVMASYAQQACNRTFCLTHGLNLHRNENYGLGHRFALCKPSLSEAVSQVDPTNVCAWPGPSELWCHWPWIYWVCFRGNENTGTFANVCFEYQRWKKKRASSCRGSCLTVPLLLKRFAKDCQICIIHATTPSSAYFPVYTWANSHSFLF